MIHILFFLIIIFSVMPTISGMDPRQRNQTLLTAYAGFLDPSIIPCAIGSTAVSVQFANEEDAQRKGNLLYEFRQEMEGESNLLNNTLQRFQNILFQIPPEKNSDEKYLATIIGEKITQNKTKIDKLYAGINYHYGILASPTLPLEQKKEVLQRLKQIIVIMQTHIIAIEEWEVVHRIFNRIECKRNLQDIALLEDSLSKEELLIGQTLAQDISDPLHPSSQETTEMSISPPQSNALDARQDFFSWLERDIKERQTIFPYKPVINPAANQTHSNEPKPTETFAVDNISFS